MSLTITDGLMKFVSTLESKISMRNNISSAPLERNEVQKLY